MSDVTIFEQRLRVALRRHVAGGPTEFDALGFARMVAATEARRRGLTRRLLWRRDSTTTVAWRRSPAAALLWPMIALMLITALVAGAVVAGSLLRPDQWHRIDLPGLGGLINDVVATDDGYLAVGIGSAPPPRQSETAVVWHSHDGLAWDIAASGDQLTGATLNAVARAGIGFVAVGSQPAPDWLDSGSPDYRSSSPTAWSSADGRSWRRVQVDTGPGSVEDIVCRNERCVAVGWDEGGARIWWSDDASHWARASHFPGDGPNMLPRLVTIVVGEAGFVAAGTNDAGAMWSSADGDTWQGVNLPSSLPATPPIWISSISIGTDGRLVGLTGEVALSRAPGESEWVATPFPGLNSGAGDLQSGGVFASWVAATAWGYVAVGNTTDPTRLGLLWTSVDGVHWRVHEAGSTFDGIGLTRVLRCGDGLLVVGTDGNGTYRIWAAIQAAKWVTALPRS